MRVITTIITVLTVLPVAAVVAIMAGPAALAILAGGGFGLILFVIWNGLVGVGLFARATEHFAVRHLHRQH